MKLESEAKYKVKELLRMEVCPFSESYLSILEIIKLSLSLASHYQSN